MEIYDSPEVGVDVQEMEQVFRKALKSLYRDGVLWKALEMAAGELISPAQEVLDNSNDMNTVIEARGRKKGLKALLRNIEAIAIREEEMEENDDA